MRQLFPRSFLQHARFATRSQLDYSEQVQTPVRPKTQRSALGRQRTPTFPLRGAPRPTNVLALGPHASPPHCLVIIPTYNEAANIQHLAAAVLAQGAAFDLLIVDDNSPDGTGELVANLAAETSRVHLLARAGKQGLGSAYCEGFERALQMGYLYICQMDADFSHQPRYLPQLLAKAEQGADVVLGSRNVPQGRVENWSLGRRLLSRGGSLYARTILGLPIRDCTGGFKCFRADALRRIDLATTQSDGYAFQVELNYRCYKAGLRIEEIPIVFPDREAGESKMSLGIVAEAALMVWKLRLNGV